jgi:hypothetical protein
MDALCSKWEQQERERYICHEDILRNGGIASPFLTSALDEA